MPHPDGVSAHNEPDSYVHDSTPRPKPDYRRETLTTDDAWKTEAALGRAARMERGFRLEWHRTGKSGQHPGERNGLAGDVRLGRAGSNGLCQVGGLR